jgi:hypothetical protein
MTTTALTNRFAESDFRIADTIRRALFILSHNSVMFGALAVGVTLPTFVLNRLENTYPSLSFAPPVDDGGESVSPSGHRSQRS